MTTEEHPQVTVWSYDRDDLPTLTLGIQDGNGFPYNGDLITLDHECLIHRVPPGLEPKLRAVMGFHVCPHHRLVLVRWASDTFNDAHTYLEVTE